MDISRFLNFRDRKQLFLDVLTWFVSGFCAVGCFNFFLVLSIKLNVYFISWKLPDAINVVAISLLSVMFYALFKFFVLQVWILKNKGKVYEFDSNDWSDKWIWSGDPKLTEEGNLSIQSSRAGFLLENYFWKNFRMTFEMDFMTEHKTIGLLFRAEDLDNYFMIQLSKKHECFKPHIRYRGGWDVFQPIVTDVFSNTNSLKVRLEVKNNTAYLMVNNNLEFTWILPTHVDVNYRESGVAIKENETNHEDINMGMKIAGHVQEIPFRLGYGKIGFRASPGEGAIIKGLMVEPL